jgi:hypothetical protein
MLVTARVSYSVSAEMITELGDAARQPTYAAVIADAVGGSSMFVAGSRKKSASART